MEGKVSKQMNVLKRYCGSNWGLKHATLIKLYKTLLLPQMLYAAPIKAWKHLQALHKLQHTALKLILGTNTTFNQLGVEILCGERHFYFSELWLTELKVLYTIPDKPAINVYKLCLGGTSIWWDIKGGTSIDLLCRKYRYVLEIRDLFCYFPSPHSKCGNFTSPSLSAMGFNCS